MEDLGLAQLAEWLWSCTEGICGQEDDLNRAEPLKDRSSLEQIAKVMRGALVSIFHGGDLI